jgi:hypothetical protein
MKESTYSAADIEKKVAARETKWKGERTNPQNDNEKRYTADQKVRLVPDIRKVMADPMLRSAEFDQARRLLRSKASRLNRDSIVLHDGSRVLLPGTVNGLVKKMQWDGISEDDVIRLSGIKNTAVKPPVGDKVLTAFKALRGVHNYTPLELLNELIENPSLEINIGKLADGATTTQIRSAFDQCEKRVGNVKRDILPNQDSYIQALRAVKTILGSDQDLITLVRYGQCMRLLEPAKETMDEDYSGQPFSREYIDGLLNRCLRNAAADRVLAVSILEEYCVKKKHLANFSLKDSKLTECLECGAVTEMGDNIMHCSVCGCGIRTKCPQCGTSQSSNNSSCTKCGFDFKGGLQRAKDLEKKFRSALSYGMVDEATDCIAKIENIYSTYPTINAMRGDLKPVASKYGSLMKQIDAMYKLKQYYSLAARIDDAKGDFPKLLNIPEISRKYDEASSKVAGADRFCDRAKIVDSHTAMPLYVSAMEVCPDHPRAREKLKENPPESPADATVRLVDGKPTVRFAVPVERAGMTFCVFRDRGSIPSPPDDAAPLAEIPGCVFQDKFPEPGTDLYYAVYSKRWGILSREAASCGPVTVFTEVENVTIESIDGGLRIKYTKPRGCSKVRIWRKEGTTAAGTGEEVEVLHDGGESIDDCGLKGGVKYHYLFVAEYRNEGKTERSLGVDYSFTTPKFPEPVRDMEIRWNRTDGSFTAKWNSKEKVVLYLSPRKVKLQGRTAKMDDIATWMTEIRPLATYEDGMKFLLQDEAVQYIYPMIPVGKVAVRGKEMMVANLRPFRDVERRISGSDCDLTMTWPPGAESAVLVVKDAKATGPDDMEGERITITREAYNNDRMIRVPMGNSKKRIVTIYAVYDVENEKMPSRGMCIDVYSGSSTKVRYTMTAERIGKDMKFMVSIDTDRGISGLPPLSAVHVREGIPLKRRDGEAIWSSRQHVPLQGGKALLTFQCPPDVNVSRVRLFFDSDENYNLFKFIHPLYGGR